LHPTNRYVLQNDLCGTKGPRDTTGTYPTGVKRYETLVSPLGVKGGNAKADITRKKARLSGVRSWCIK